MYAKIIDNQVIQYPYSIRDLRADYPNTSFPNNLTENDLLSYNVYKIQSTPKPSCETNQRVQETTLVLENGVWKQAWETINLSEEEYAALVESLARRVRVTRDTMIKEFVDVINPMRWESMSDEQKQAWRNYRQELLDVPEQESFPWEIEWPVSPS